MAKIMENALNLGNLVIQRGAQKEFRDLANSQVIELISVFHFGTKQDINDYLKDPETSEYAKLVFECFKKSKETGDLGYINKLTEKLTGKPKQYIEQDIYVDDDSERKSIEDIIKESDLTDENGILLDEPVYKDLYIA